MPEAIEQGRQTTPVRHLCQCLDLSGQCAGAGAEGKLCDLSSTRQNREDFARLVDRINAADATRVDLQSISDQNVTLQAWQKAVTHVNEHARSGDAAWIVLDGHAAYESGLSRDDGTTIEDDYYFPAVTARITMSRAMSVSIRRR